MKRNLGRYFCTVGVVCMIYACGDGAGETAVQDEGEMDEMTSDEQIDEPKKVVYYATPSLVDVASMMKAAGASFSPALLNDPANSQNYATHYKKAINMGVYGADLTYCAMFDETQKSINYLKTVKSMSDDLGLEGAFEQDLLQSIEQNITDRDALLDVITDFYWSADSYLTDNERIEVSALIITGGWIESMFLACDMASRHPENEMIRQRIAEQKLILKNLLMFLAAGASDDEAVAECITELKGLQEVYNKIEVNQGSGNSVTDSEKGETVIGNETEITMTQEQLDEMCTELSKIRKRYIDSK